MLTCSIHILAAVSMIEIRSCRKCPSLLHELLLRSLSSLNRQIFSADSPWSCRAERPAPCLGALLQVCCGSPAAGEEDRNPLADSSLNRCLWHTNTWEIHAFIHQGRIQFIRSASKDMCDLCWQNESQTEQIYSHSPLKDLQNAVWFVWVGWKTRLKTIEWTKSSWSFLKDPKQSHRATLHLILHFFS